MLYKIMCTTMHRLNGAIPGPHVPVLVTCGGLVAHTYAHILKYTYAPPCCRTLQYSRTFIPLSMSLWNDFLPPYSMVLLTGGFQKHGQCFFIGLSSSIPTIDFFDFPLSLLSVYIGWYCLAEVFGLIGCTSLSLSLAMRTSFNNNICNNNNNSYNNNVIMIYIII